MNDAPKKLAIIGWPVNHSRSPLIHNHWLSAQGVAGEYEPYAIDPKDDFRAALAAMAANGFVGANVTIPHKQTAFAAMDVLSDSARALGAVNTISMKQGRFIGDNTDGEGFLASLDAAAPGHDWRQRPVLVLGAGGAARAIIAALGRAGVPDIRLTNRTRDKADALAGLADNLTIGDWQKREALAAACGLLVNTTSLGMQGQPPLDMALSGLARGALVSDIVYTPLQTLLLAAAEQQGFIAVDGLGMLMQQAALSFEIWTGIRPEVNDDLRDVLVADLAGDE